jgi:predicted transcriptional regulator
MAELSINRAPTFLRMTTDVVAAYLRHNALPSGQITDIIHCVYHSLRNLDSDGGPSDVLKPAVAIRKSIHPDYLTCLEDGKKLKMLKRHLRSTYHLTPDQYRHKWGLPPDYPMVAPNYAAQRSAFAKKIGLGRNGSRRNVKRAVNGLRK